MSQLLTHFSDNCQVGSPQKELFVSPRHQSPLIRQRRTHEEQEMFAEREAASSHLLLSQSDAICSSLLLQTAVRPTKEVTTCSFPLSHEELRCICSGTLKIDLKTNKRKQLWLLLFLCLDWMETLAGLWGGYCYYYYYCYYPQ